MDATAICLDTGPLIAYLKGREPGATAVTRVVQEYTCYVTAITAYELLFGVARAKKEIGEDALLEILAILPFNGKAARNAATLHAHMIAQNLDIGIKDTFICEVFTFQPYVVRSASVGDKFAALTAR
jgi:tRNA(fMet)-specific endonuclease VapC